jgi:hypothetical protein
MMRRDAGRRTRAGGCCASLREQGNGRIDLASGDRDRHRSVARAGEAPPIFRHGARGARLNDVANGVTDRLAAAVPGAHTDRGPVRDAHRGRLFRKYLLLILTLVTIALLASGGISVYFTYQETKASLASLQHEKAIAAASRIEQYIRQIERQLSFAALPQLDASNVELRRIEFLKLERNVHIDLAQFRFTPPKGVDVVGDE